LVIGPGLLEVLGQAQGAGAVGACQRVQRRGVVLLFGLAVPLDGLGGVLGYAGAVRVGAAEAVFARRFALFGRFLVHRDRFRLGSRVAQQVAKARLRLGVVLGGGLAQEFHAGGQVALGERRIRLRHVLGRPGVEGGGGEQRTDPQRAPDEE